LSSYGKEASLNPILYPGFPGGDFPFFLAASHPEPRPQEPAEPKEERVVPISNLPENSSDVPELIRDFAIQRLRRQISHLKSEIKSLTDAKRYKDGKLLKQKHLWKLGLDYGEWPTLGEALRNLTEIESGIVYEGRLFTDELQKQGLEESEEQ